MASALSSCAYNPKNLHPHFIDTNDNTCREYEVIEVKPKLVFKFKESHPLTHCRGFIALPTNEAQEIRSLYLLNQDLDND